MNLLLCLALCGFAAADETPFYEAEQIFRPVEPQTHAPGIVETASGELIASWYGGTEGPESDAAVLGARKKKGESAWSKPFMMADRPGFPDCNTCMMIDGKQRLWLFWPTVIGDSWESCLMNYRVSTDYNQPGAPKWDREAIMLLKPANFRDEALKLLGDGKLRPPRGAKGGPDEQRAKLDDTLYQRLGWAPRCKPTVLPSGRILLPLYTDTFAISIMAISDDDGATWYASQPLIGFGNIQPTVLRRNDGVLVAYMRENGPRACIRVSESKDDGLTWSPVGDSYAAESRQRHRRRSPGQRPLGARLQRRQRQPRGVGRFDFDGRRPHLDVDPAPGKARRRPLPLPGDHPGPRRHDPRHLQLLHRARASATAGGAKASDPERHQARGL